MKTKYLFAIILSVIFLLKAPTTALARSTFWEIQSIDTVKYSRDLAKEKEDDFAFAQTIDAQMKKIAEVGATHVAIGTPYDPEFTPYLRLWVNSARKYGLNIWFRGNFAGWEGWFNYSRITPDEHKSKVSKFIEKNPELFKEGDIFTPCTECENGTIGDPRETGNVEGFRKLLIDEYKIASGTFNKINKKVKTGFFSMNGDVAKLIMDKETTKKLGGVVVVDHYVKGPKELAYDVQELAKNSGGQIVLGEIGVPIPDIHGVMNETQQNFWLSEALYSLSQNPNVIGLNYWVLEGGSTQIWPNTSKKAAAVTLSTYFSPPLIKGKVSDEINNPLSNVVISINGKTWETDNQGEFEVPLVPSASKLLIQKDNYQETSLESPKSGAVNEIVLKRTKDGFFFSIKKILFKVKSLFTGKK